MESKSKSATFSKRFVAYIIDVMIVSIIVSILSLPFIDAESVDKLNNDAQNLSTNLLEKKIDNKTYITEYASLNYQVARQEGAMVLITAFVSIIYFVIYQFKKAGQTIGKKVMKIKVVSDDGELSINSLVIRSVIINSIIFQLLQVLLVSITSNSMDYFMIEFGFECIQNIIIIVSALMILYTKKKKGLHDMLAKTSVVNV